MTAEEVIGCLIKADFLIEKSYWQIKNIPHDDARRAGITIRRLNQVLRRLENVDAELIDMMNKIKSIKNERNNV